MYVAVQAVYRSILAVRQQKNSHLRKFQNLVTLYLNTFLIQSYIAKLFNLYRNHNQA